MTKYSGRLGFVRHGQTSANIDLVWHGHTDTALTELGLEQARKLGEYFHHYMQPDIVFASPLQRARLTAQAVAERFEVPLYLDERLMEFNLGDWEGMSYQSLREGDDILKQLIVDKDFTAPNGESQNMVRRRVLSAIEEITEKHPEKNLLVVAHGVTLGIALSHYVEGDASYWTKYSKDNTAFSELCLNSKTLLSYNLTHHLDEQT